LGCALYFSPQYVFCGGGYPLFIVSWHNPRHNEVVRDIAVPDVRPFANNVQPAGGPEHERHSQRVSTNPGGPQVFEVNVLGPLLVSHNGVNYSLPGVKLSCILAALALRANQPVHRDELVNELALERSKNAANAVQAHVARLRRWLNDTCQARNVLVTSGHCYQLELPPVRVDAHRFVELVELCWANEDEPRAVASSMERALGLWRGDALSDVGDGPLVRSAVDSLHRLRLSAQDTLLDARLAMGDELRVILQASKFIAVDPLRERSWEQLMAALHRSGRHAEAVETFHRVRRVLANELGIEPGPKLCAQFQEVLSHRAPEPLTASA